MTIRMLAVLALSVLLLGQSLRESALRIWHEWERESFAQYFCVNIDEPAVMCYGQCQIDELDAEHQAGDQGASIRPPVKRLGSLDYCFDHPTL
ncbi:MAG: hypothetical protein KDC54_13140, partial [Lewinella sp.]|nr:hypothetical protein [Lewinella sp.]